MDTNFFFSLPWQPSFSCFHFAEPVSGAGDDYWSMQTMGYIRADHTGWYRLRVLTERGSATLYVDNEKLMHYTTDFSKWVYFAADSLHLVYVQYTHHYWDARMRLMWTPPGSFEEAVPKENLYYSDAGFNCQCPHNITGGQCSGRGTCMQAACVCDGIFTGHDCEELRCSNDECINSDNDLCSDPTQESAHNVCGGQGTCRYFLESSNSDR